jgi:hypothetical protein
MKDEMGGVCSAHVCTIFCFERQEGERPREHLEYLVVDGNIKLKWMLRVGSRRVAPSCGHSNESFDSIQDEQFLEYLSAVLISQRGVSYSVERGISSGITKRRIKMIA